MTDIFSAEKRSAVMRAIRSSDTKPELTIRHALHRLGYRFRLCVRDLPGHPDIVLPRYRVAVQVRGCFWHHHPCKYARMPKTRTAFWRNKLETNACRDIRNDRLLRSAGWNLVVVWTCRIRTQASIRRELRRIVRVLESHRPQT